MLYTEIKSELGLGRFQYRGHIVSLKCLLYRPTVIKIVSQFIVILVKFQLFFFGKGGGGALPLL